MGLYCCDCGKVIEREDRYIALAECPGDIRFAHAACHRAPRKEKVARPGPRLNASKSTAANHQGNTGKNKAA